MLGELSLGAVFNLNVWEKIEKAKAVEASGVGLARCQVFIR
jgi:hypothetical protein